MRKIININKQWKFKRQDEEQALEKSYEDKDWEHVNVPHTWNAMDGADGSDFYMGGCWYRKEFRLAAMEEGKKVYIEFNGANSITEVYVNGIYIGEHKGGYSIFRFDITDVIEYGTDNIISVKVDNTVVDDVYPQKADFTFYGGIYRDVNIIIVDNLHFDMMDYGSQGIYINQENVSYEKACLKIKTKIVNHYETDKKVRVWVDILDAAGRNVTYGAKEINLDADEIVIAEIPVEIESPILWNGRKNPYLYQAKVSIESYNDTVDEILIPFGVRYFEVDSEKGFFLNGGTLITVRSLKTPGPKRHGLGNYRKRAD